MGDVTLTFDDGSVVRLHLAPGAAGPGGTPGGTGNGHPAPGTADADDPDRDDGPELPEDFGTARPVSVDGRAARALTLGGQALTDALRPLGGVLQGIHHSFARFAQRPDEVTVEFGVTLGADLSLGVFSGRGDASFTVSATWNLADGPAGADGAPHPDGAATAQVPDGR
ncbi:CU044_2847 family protein [Streptomyces sp. NPDC057638]|uniref:CU044_2847 family protein n=1 Tax=Streptomyces sp. NPDC057638 TaxID=3346190 RepID=UPI00368EB6B6